MLTKKKTQKILQKCGETNMKITIVMVFLMLGSFLAGMELADTLNPYEQCKRMYTTPEDIGECLWIKENPQ